MSASLPPKPKRPLSPPPADTTIRRVRQRTGTNLSSPVKVTPKKRDESPEEGEVEDEGEIPSVAHDDGAVNGTSSANGIANGTSSKEDELEKEKAAAAGGKPKKVAFPFKSRAQKVQAIPTVDMENGPPIRPTMPLISPSKAEYVRGGSGSRHGFEENGVGASGRDSYVPQHSRGYDSYVPSRDRDRGSPKATYERRRSWSPPHRDDGPDGRGRGRSRSPVEAWDTYIAPKYQDPTGRIYKGRLADTYVAPGEGSPNQRHWQRSSSRGGGASGPDYYRPHADSPPRERSPPERGAYPRSDRYSPGPAPHRLPPRPPSPDRYVPSRHNDRSWNYNPRDQDWDRRDYPPRTPTRTPPQPPFEPPPLPTGDMGMDGLPPRPRVSFSRRGDGAAVLLQQQQQQQQNQQPFPPGQRPAMPTVAKPQAVYTRPPQAQAPAAALPPPPPAPLIEPKVEVVPPPPSERQEKPKASKHKVARVRTKDEERTAYDREFVGSGRIKDYTILNKLGEGTFGEVHRAQLNKPEPGKPVKDLALKRIIMHSEKDGMPITALREIKILKALNHPNIVPVLDIVVQPRTPSAAGSVFMVFPYMDHDLAGLLENKAVQLAQSHIKLYMKQLLEGLEYMHENHIIHRDIKAANILISNEGVLQIADFGLARAYVKKTKQERIEEGKKRGRPEKYTNCVVTRWYRPPELLLGERLYGAEIDLWGVGCILAEMFVRRPIFQGQSDMDQLEKIWWLCGTPTKDTWPDFDTLPGLDGVKDFRPREKSLRNFLGRFDSITRETMDLIESLLSLDPAKRPTASEALLHDYFWTTPLPADPKIMPKYEASHELDRRRKEVPPAPPPNPHQHSYQFQGPQGHGGGPFNHFNRGGGGGGRGMPMGRGGGPMHQQRPFHPAPPGMQGPGSGPYPMVPMGLGHMPGPPGLPLHPSMHGPPPPHGVSFPPHMNQQQHPGLPPPPIPPPNTNGGLPVPRGFRPPPPPRAQYQQPPYPGPPGPGQGPGNYNGRPPGPNNGNGGPPPPGMGGGGPPRDRGPAPPNDPMVLHYG